MPGGAGKGRGTALRSMSGRAWIDILVLSTLSLLGVVGFEPSFGGYSFLMAGLGGLIVGSAAGVLTYLLRLGPVSSALAAIVAYFLFGSALAMPGAALFGVLPTLRSLVGLAIGAVFGWADLVTLQTPIGAPDYIAVVPYLATWLVGLLSTLAVTHWFIGKPRKVWKSGLILVGPTAIYLAGVLTGTDQPYLAGIRGITFAVVALVWVGWRRAVGERVSLATGRSIVRRKLTGTAILVVAAVALGALAGTFAAPPSSSRFVLREEVTPPFDPLNYPSPLAGFRVFTKDNADKVMFTVAGLKPGEQLRMATMDSYDGKLWNVAGPEVATNGSGSYNLVGKKLPKASLLTAAGTSTVMVTIKNYDDVWLPSVGYPTSIQLRGTAAKDNEGLRYNTSTGSLVLTDGVHKGDSYTITAKLQNAPSAAELKSVAPAGLQLPAAADVPGIVTSKATEYKGSSKSPDEQLTAIARALASKGFLSHGLDSDAVKSMAGHGADRMDSLLTGKNMVGDQEQFASAFALMARQLGYPARVVMGFAPKVAAGQKVVSVKGSDVTAWVEVAFDGVGWVPFNPTPKATDVPQDQAPKPKSEPQPQVRQPPRSDTKQDNLLSAVEIDNSKKKDDAAPFVLPGWAIAIAGVVGIPLVLYFVPLLVVAEVKRRRRSRRRSASTGDGRVAGAWDELVDSYAELGYSMPRRASRVQIALKLEEQENAQPGDSIGETGASQLRTLADGADQAVFSGAEVATGEAESFWATVLESVDVARLSVGRWRRQLGKFRIHPKRDWVERLTITELPAKAQTIRGVFFR